MDFLQRNEHKIYYFAAEMRAYSKRNRTNEWVIRCRRPIEPNTQRHNNNDDDYNDSPTSLATLPTLPCRPSTLVNLLLLYFMISLTHFTFPFGGTMLSIDSKFVRRPNMRFLWVEKGSHPVRRNWCTENWFVCKRLNTFVKIKTSFFASCTSGFRISNNARLMMAVRVRVNMRVHNLN